MKSKSYRYILLLILLAALAVRLYELNEPWTGLKDFTGALHGQIARNYVKLGLAGTALGPVTNFEEHPKERTYYMHHPILFNILLSVPIRIFGEKEWAMRLLPVAASILGILLLFFLTRMLWGTRTALYASFFLAFMPMDGYFGRMVNEEALAATLMLGLLILYVKNIRRAGNPERPMSRSFYALLFVGLFTAWPVYYLAGLFFLHDFVSRIRQKGAVGYSFILPAMALCCFALFLLHGRYLTGGWGQSLLVIFLERAGAESEVMRKSVLLLVLTKRFISFFTPVVLVLAVIALPGIPSKKTLYPRGGIPVLLILYLVAAIHVVLFREGALHHEYWLFYFSLPLAMSAALGLEYLMSRFRQRTLRALVVIAVLGIFVSLSVPRIVALHAIDKFEHVPELGEWIRDNTREDDEILVIGPALAGFGYSPQHFDYHLGNVYTWPMPHMGYYARRRIQWGIKDLDELKAIIAEPGKLKYAVMTEEHMDSLVRAARDYLSSTCAEIIPEDWKNDESIPLQVFELDSGGSREPGGPPEAGGPHGGSREAGGSRGSDESGG